MEIIFLALGSSIIFATFILNVIVSLIRVERSNFNYKEYIFAIVALTFFIFWMAIFWIYVYPLLCQYQIEYIINH